MTDGFINVLKPPGMSSGAVVGLVKRVSGQKVGHAGTLDPEAAGVLPVMVGRATRLFDFLVEKRKTYLAEAAFGTETDTQDAQGKAIAHGENYPSLARIREVLPAFAGEILQRPPMYSAMKKDGQPLYKLARKGEAADIPARPVWIESIDALCETPRHGCIIRVVCGRGTYIRTLCRDIGQALHCPAHMRFLLREQTGAFDLSTAVTIEELKRTAETGELPRYILPLDYPLAHLARYDVPQRLIRLCENGVALRANEWPGAVPPGGHIRLYANGTFLGISRAEADGTLVPRVVLNKQEGSTI